MTTRTSIERITHFISGHLSLTEAEFEQHYRPQLDMALAKGHAFVVGDARGADDLAQRYLHGRTANVTVFHMLEHPRHNAGFPVRGGFQSDAERDESMTLHSDQDIAWVRPGRESSGTQKNVDRRSKRPKS